MPEYRRIFLDGAVVPVTRDGDELVVGDGRRVPTEDAHHLPPVQPGKVLAVHLNYTSRVEEFQVSLPPAPTYFQKPLSALNGHRGDIIRPNNCKWLNFEGEIAIVIGRTARGVSHARAWDHIAGYTITNDYGLHDFRDTDAGSMLRVKGSDTLCPLGPGLVTDWDPREGQVLQTLVNGEVVQEASTAEMTWDMAYLVADLARTITLDPGDVILSGTPAYSRTAYPGDVVEVTVEGLGTLTNTIVDGPLPVSDEVGAQPTETEQVLSTARGGDWEFRGQRPPVATDFSQVPVPRVDPR